MVDKLVEDIVEVTETLMEFDVADIEAFAHQHLNPSLNERIGKGKFWPGWRKWRDEKAAEFKAKMKEHQKSGVFKRGVC